MALTLDDTNVIDLFMDAAVDRLDLDLKDNVTDDARAGLVRAGRLQDDPTNKRINVLIHPGGRDWPDEINTNNDGPDWAMPTYTIGSRVPEVHWRRRIRIQMELFYSNELSRINSRKKALTTMQRCVNSLLKWDVAAELVRDTFGETVYGLQVVKSWLDEGGGPGDFNWRGEMWVEYLTSIEPV